MIRNLTPHPVRLYPDDAPDVVGPGDVPDEVIPVHGPPARLAMVMLSQDEAEPFYPAEGHGPWGADTGHGVAPILPVEYGHATGLPEPDGGWFLVSLPLALALPQRTDLLVTYREVRDEAGTVVGCRRLARPLVRPVTTRIPPQPVTLEQARAALAALPSNGLVTPEQAAAALAALRGEAAR